MTRQGSFSTALRRKNKTGRGSLGGRGETVTEVIFPYQCKSCRSGHQVLSADEIMARPQRCFVTARRVLTKLQDQLHVPIAFGLDRGDYVLEQGKGLTDAESPGLLWFSPLAVAPRISHRSTISLSCILPASPKLMFRGDDLGS